MSYLPQVLEWQRSNALTWFETHCRTNVTLYSHDLFPFGVWHLKRECNETWVCRRGELTPVGVPQVAKTNQLAPAIFV